jgi:hypothetical protein
VPNSKPLVQGVSRHSPPGQAGVPSGGTGPDGRREEARLATTLWSVGLAVILWVAGTLALAHKGASTQRFPGVSGEIPKETQPPRPSRSRTKTVYGNPSKESIAKISGVDRATLSHFIRSRGLGSTVAYTSINGDEVWPPPVSPSRQEALAMEGSCFGWVIGQLRFSQSMLQLRRRPWTRPGSGF